MMLNAKMLSIVFVSSNWKSWKSWKSWKKKLSFWEEKFFSRCEVAKTSLLAPIEVSELAYPSILKFFGGGCRRIRWEVLRYPAGGVEIFKEVSCYSNPIFISSSSTRTIHQKKMFHSEHIFIKKRLTYHSLRISVSHLKKRSGTNGNSIVKSNKPWRKKTKVNPCVYVQKGPGQLATLMHDKSFEELEAACSN